MTKPIPFDGVFKMGGVWASAGTPTDKSTAWIKVSDTDSGLQLSVPDYHSPIMSVAEARSLAAQIMELARRHEVRKAKG